MSDLSVVILAAGQGKRMYSALPKVLHEVGGLPLLERVVRSAQALGSNQTFVVYGHGGDTVNSQLNHLAVNWVEQAEQLGTGHAVAQALPEIPDDHIVLVLYGDVPLIDPAVLRQLIGVAGPDAMGLLTVKLDDPTGYGRIVRDASGNVVQIVEEKDADETIKAITEANTGFLAAPAKRLRDWLTRIGNSNSQGEFYLTDIIELAVADSVEVTTVTSESVEEVSGINDKVQLARLERYYQMKQAEELMKQGVTLRDPARFDVRGEVTVGKDVVIDINVILEGKVTIGDGVNIGPNVILKNVEIGDGVQIFANSMIEDSVVGARCRIGPFSRIRPETRLAEEVHIGNFTEIKKSDVASGAKINHLSYIGDSDIGSKTNIGAGTITCNYDGANKFRTIIGDDVFVGSDTQLVAPVTVANGATIGAGSTITRDVPGEGLTVARHRGQTTMESWQRPHKKK